MKLLHRNNKININIWSVWVIYSGNTEYSFINGIGSKLTHKVHITTGAYYD